MTQKPDDAQHRRARRLRTAHRAANARGRVTFDTHQTAAAEAIRAHELAQLERRVESVQLRTEHALQQQGEASVRIAHGRDEQESVGDRMIQL